MLTRMGIFSGPGREPCRPYKVASGCRKWLAGRAKWLPAAANDLQAVQSGFRLPQMTLQAVQSGFRLPQMTLQTVQTCFRLPQMTLQARKDNGVVSAKHRCRKAKTTPLSAGPYFAIS